MADDGIIESIKQPDVSNVVHNWATEYAKRKDIDAKPVHICISGSGVTGKSHLVKAVFNAVSKTLLFNCKEPEKPRVFLYQL